MLGATSRRRRLLKGLLVGVALLVLSLGALVLFLPAILSSDFVRERFARGVGDRLGTEVEVASLRLAWRGTQEVRGIRVASPTAGEEDLFRAESILLERGLLGLLDLVRSREGTISVVVDGPALHVRRDAEGRFNFEPLLRNVGTGSPQEPGKDHSGKGPSGKGPSETGPSEKGPSGEGPGAGAFPTIRVVVKGGAATYRDANLGTASSLDGLEATLDVRPARVAAEANGTVREEGGSPGSFRLHLVATGLGGVDGDPDVTASAELRDIDLRPYRALLERLAGVSAPEKPLTGKLAVVSGERGLDVEGELDAGFGRIERLACTVPRKGAGDRATLTLPWSAELPATLAFLGPRLALPEGARLQGQASGTLTLAAPLTLDDLSAKESGGRPMDVELDVQLDATARDLDILWPRAAGEADGLPPEPLRVAREELTLGVHAVADGASGALRLESARLRAEGIDAELSGRVTPEVAGPDGTDARARVVDIGLSLRLAIPELVSLLGDALPPEIEIDPESIVLLEGFSLRGEGGGESGAESGGGSGPERWEGSGRIDVRGPIRRGGISVEGISSDLRLDGKRLELPGLSCRLNGGEVRAPELSLDLEEKPAYRISLRAEGVAAHQDMAPLLAYVLPFLSAVDREAEFSGSIRGTLELSGRGFGLDDLREGLSGKGSLRVAEGRIAASAFLRELAGILGASLDRVLFHDLGSDFAVGEGRIVSSNLFLQGREGSNVRSIAFDGWTGVDGRIDYGVKLSSLRDSIGDRRARRVLEYAERFLGGGMLPLRLRGTVAAPQLSLDLDAAGRALGGLDLGGLLDGVIPLLGPSGSTREKEEPSKDPREDPSDDATKDPSDDATKDPRGDGTQEPTEDAGAEGKPIPPREDPRDAIERGLRGILDEIRKRHGSKPGNTRF